MSRHDKNQTGIALMVVLWVMVLLMALATEFAFSMKMEVNTTRNYKEDIESYHLAKAGINLAMAEILKPARFHAIHPEFGWITGAPVSTAPQAGDVPEESAEASAEEFEHFERDDIPFGNGTITYTITDENGKIPINTVSREILIKVLTLSGLEVGTERDVIADSILDWIDSDDKHRLNGAEDEYYRTLFPPYQAKNSKFETLDELLRVRGVTEEILYGAKEGDEEIYQGLDKFLTVYNVSGINPNTASEEILPAFYSETQVKDILEARAEKGYYSDFTSSHFRIKSTGKIEGSPTRHTIVAIVEKITEGKNDSLFIHYWNDNDLES
ncbi:MAG: hypothetical protein V3U37_04755 [Nitrospinaceae bacterium]